MEQIVFQSQNGYFLRILKTDVSTMKKTSVGVRGMKLGDGDVLEHAYLVEPRQEYTIQYHDKPYALNKVKLAKRDTKGMKPRIKAADYEEKAVIQVVQQKLKRAESKSCYW